MVNFTTDSGWTAKGEIVEYFVSDDGRHMARVRLGNSRACVTAPVAGLKAVISC